MRTRTIRRTAISLPAELLSDVDRAARDLGVSRSGYITRILRLAVRARCNAAITRRLDELFADAAVAAEQRRSAAELDAAGSGWNNERW
jgi:metal-responsive CopG/Arc/MetJ family transcriptional regulator